MTRIDDTLGAVARQLSEIGHRWALVGGLAVSVRTEPRFTRDLDVAVAVGDDTAAEALAQSSSCADTGSSPMLAMKLLSRDDRTRPQDRLDIRALLSVAASSDLERARDALAVIAARGYHRGKDLAAELERALGEL